MICFYNYPGISVFDGKRIVLPGFRQINLQSEFNIEYGIGQVIVGSCTNSSFRDLSVVAAVLGGRTVHPGVSFAIAPGSRQVLQMIARSGALNDLFFEGKKGEAIAAVPDGFVDEISLIGPVERIRDRLEAWRESPVTTLSIGGGDLGLLRTMAELVDA